MAAMPVIGVNPEIPVNKANKVARALNKEVRGGIKTIQFETVPPSHSMFRSEVYKGGDIKDPYFSFFTTDPNYAKQYGSVHKYLLEQKGLTSVSKEPMIGSRDVVANDMFIDRNGVSGGNVIIGHDAVTSDIPIKSNGVEILSYRKPSTLKVIDDLSSTYHYNPKADVNGKPAITRVVGDNGKIRLRLASHTTDKPREFVLDPQGNNKFRVHMRT